MFWATFTCFIWALPALMQCSGYRARRLVAELVNLFGGASRAAASLMSTSEGACFLDTEKVYQRLYTLLVHISASSFVVLCVCYLVTRTRF